MAYDESMRTVSLDADDTIGIYTGVPGQPGSPVPHGAKQYHFVKITGAHTAGLATSATDPVVGVLLNKPQTPGSASTVAFSGIPMVVAGGPIDPGDEVAPNGEGKAVKAAAGAGIGIAIEAAAKTGQIVPVLLK